MRNRIVKNNSDFWEGLNPYAFQNVHWDGTVTCPEGLVTREIIEQNPLIEEIARKVLDGTIESPVYDWTCFLPYDYWGYESGYYFAEVMGVC